MPQYKRPPITEAVLEFRFTQPIKRENLEATARKLSSAYPISEF